MLTTVAITGPQRVSWLLRGDVVDADRIFGKRQVSAVRVGLRVQDGGLLECGFFRVAGPNVSCVKLAPQGFRVAALPEDAVVMEAAVETPVTAHPLQEESDVGGLVYEGPTVRVKFELQRECHFGQEFKVVGGDPQFGDWDPTAAVPLNWSEGHLWTAEVDVPEGKNFEFKYVLSGQEGEVEWQPGSNLVLEAAAGAQLLVISEAWEEPQTESTLEVQPAELDVQPAEPEVDHDEPDIRDWEAVSGDTEVSTPGDALADVAASAAAGALNAGLKAATALEGGLDAVLPVSDSPSSGTNGVAESKEDETPTAVEIPVVDAALAAAAAPAEEPTNENEASIAMTNQVETATTEEALRVENQSRIEEPLIIEEQSVIDEQPITEEEPKKRVFPFQKDLEWLSKNLFGK